MMMVALVALVACWGAAASTPAPATAPPFAFGLDQSVPCPIAAQDYSVAGVPIDANASAALQQALGRVPAMLDTKIQELACPSANVVVTHGGQIIFRSYRGSARMHSQAALHDDTGFKIASLTKTFTTAMLFQLRDAGKLSQSLDTPVTELIPGFTIKSPYKSKRGITLRSLAMHASGMPRNVPLLGVSGEAAMLKAIAEMTVISPQYTQTHYSNLGIALLGRALEKVAGISWEQYVATKILEPLGMNGSGNPPFSAAARARMADGAKSPGVIEPLPNATDWGSPCGSMYSTPGDMVRWMNFLMDVRTVTTNSAVTAPVIYSSATLCSAQLLYCAHALPDVLYASM